MDWLACVVGGWDEPSARAARGAEPEGLGRVVALGAAGHALDFDDTYPPGLVHCSAPTAPAALVIGADAGASVEDVLEAYAAGFEAMAAVARASHPMLYERGWHATAVCGVVGAASAAARLLGLEMDGTRRAIALGMLQAGGLRAAFGSDGKPLQVGMAAAAGVRGALLASAGASAPPGLVTGPGGFEGIYGGRWAEPDPAEPPAIRENWIKAYPCCLQTHSAIEATDRLRPGISPAEPVIVTVHPISRQAARYDDVETGLQAKFSIPYLVAFTLRDGPPKVADFRSVDPVVRRAAARVRVRTDPRLLESEAIVESAGGGSVRVEVAQGSPARPLAEAQLLDKRASLGAGELRLDAVDPPARSLLGILGPW